MSYVISFQRIQKSSPWLRRTGAPFLECFNNSFVVGLCSTHIVLTFSVLYIELTFYKGLLTLDKVICLLENLKDKLVTTKVNQ